MNLSTLSNEHVNNVTQTYQHFDTKLSTL